MISVRSDYEPIIISTPKAFSHIEVYVLGDLHYGSKQFDERKWNAVKDEILEASNRYCVFVGDLMENAVPGSRSSMFEQVCNPQDQKEWVTQQFADLKDRILGVVDGNHEKNRSYKYSGLFPLFDATVIAGIEDKYRPHFAFIDVGIGQRKKDASQQTHYVIYMSHKAKDAKNYCSSDFVENVDLFCYGHDHTGKTEPRGKLIYDTKLKMVRQMTVTTIDCGSCLSYGGYAADNAYRPNADTLYKATLLGGEKRVYVTGYSV